LAGATGKAFSNFVGFSVNFFGRSFYDSLRADPPAKDGNRNTQLSDTYHLTWSFTRECPHVRYLAYSVVEALILERFSTSSALMKKFNF
jgi:hypothetical protein